MSVLDRHPDHTRPDAAPPDSVVDRAREIDLTDEERGEQPPPASDAATAPEDGRRLVAMRGMRIRRVRLASLAQIAAVFCGLAYGVLVGTTVVLWNVAQRLGLVEETQDLVATSLGLESFELVGQELFRLVVVGGGVLALLGLVTTLLLAVVYNVTCDLFGGLALETGPLRHHRVIYSPERRRYVRVRV